MSHSPVATLDTTPAAAVAEVTYSVVFPGGTPYVDRGEHRTGQLMRSAAGHVGHGGVDGVDGYMVRDARDGS